MNAKVKPAIAPNLSFELNGFQLTKKHQSLLEKFDKLQNYMRLANKEPPCLRLSRADFAEINAVVVKQSQGKRELGQLTYRNLPILSAATP